MQAPAAKKKRAKTAYHTAKRHATYHYYRVMPDKKHHRVMIWSAFLLYVLVVSIQLLYPLDRALPLATVSGQYVGGKSHDELAAVIQDKFQSTKIQLVTKEKTVTYPVTNAGADIDTENAILQTQEYPFLWRYVPFSILWQPAQVNTYGLGYSNAVLSEFSAARAKELTVAPINARLDIKDGKIIALDDKYGGQVSADILQHTLQKAQIQLGQTNIIRIDAKSITPERPATDFDSVHERAAAVLENDLVLEAGGKEFVPTAKERASWLRIGSDEQGMPNLTLDETALGAYLDTIDKSVGTPAGETHVTIVNGVETARVVGTNGMAVDRDPLITVLQTWVKDGQIPLRQTLVLHEVPPLTVYNNKYTASQEGLQAYINDVAAQMDVHIAVQELDGAKWSASVGADDSMPSASTYKLYVAKWLFTEMDAGRIGWNDPILETNVTTCFDRMTIASTNPCAQEWLRQLGRENMNNFVYSLGFSHGTSFTNADATHTTANDLKKYMIGLNDGSLVGGAYRDRLLHSLSVHPYRYGIPTGSKGTVQDKVGFLWDYVHDAAIVHHPRGTYVLVIMTKGQSYARIASLTREIERILYP